MREIVFDTETTGFDVENGDRLVEIGAIELVNHVPTGRTFHQYINPEREVPEEAFKVHGLSYEFLKDYPTFDKVADQWLEFVGDAVLVAHNASFDFKFMNGQLKELGKPLHEWKNVIDTLEMARNMFPGSRCSLDALCKRFEIDNSHRTKHGALLDAELLADVYLELLGGREPTLLGGEQKAVFQQDNDAGAAAENKKYREPRNFQLSAAEEEAHRQFLEKEIKDAIWLKDSETVVQ